MICNCQTDIDKILCDVPAKWRKALIQALCFTLHSKPQFTCDMVENCETLTYLAPLTIDGTTISTSYRNERGQTIVRSIDIEAALNEAGSLVDPSCIMSEEDWAELTHAERIQAIIDAMCDCCPATTTTSTTTTTTQAFDYYFADVYECNGLSGTCILLDEDLVVRVPVGFINTPGMYYPGAEVSNDDLYFQITGPAVFDPSFEIIETTGSLTCGLGCATTTTTTTSTTTTTTNCCSITEADIEEITTTTTTSTTTTTTAP
jgi:hypothetical protein